MRVLHLSESHQWSGGAAQIMNLARGLRGLGVEQALACPLDGDLAGKAMAEGFTTYPFYPRQDYDLISARCLARVIRDFRPDLLHAHHSRAHAVALFAKLVSRPRPKLVVSRRVSFPVGDNLFSRLKYGSALIDGYIVVADSVGEVLVRGGVDRAKIRTIYSGVDLERFSPRPPDAGVLKELAVPAGTPLVGLIANFGHWKGQTVFLEAAAELSRRGVPAVFILAGKGTDSAEVKGLARKLGVFEASRRLLGFRMDVPAVVSCLAVSVNAATEGEGLSGALRESLAMGIPVVASDVAGNRELVRPGETGELFAPGNAKVLADCIQGLLADPARARRLAEAGRAWVGTNMTVERMVERTHAFYRELISRE